MIKLAEEMLSLTELEKKLEKLQMTQVQIQQLKDLGDTIAENLGMPNNSIRGLYYYSVIDWQKQINLTIAETESKASTHIEVRVGMLMQVFANFRVRSYKLLERKKKLHLLEDALKEALIMYANKYATRPPDNDAPE